MKQTQTTKNITKKKETMPLVSVIMPVYNAIPFLREALDSVFAQTYTNMEVIAIDDASTDGSLALLKQYQQIEPRLIVLHNTKNLGPSGAANRGIQAAKGNYIARMDADDIMPKYRIEKQLTYMRKHPSVVVIGGQVELVTIDGNPIVTKFFPKTHEEIMALSFVTIPLQQGAMMVYKKLLPKDFIWYKEEIKDSEDLDFLYRAFHYGQAVNMPETMLYYRQHGASITQANNPKKLFIQTFRIRRKALETFGYQVSKEALLLYTQYVLVMLLPTSLIYPLYYIWRGMLTLQLPRHGILPFFNHVKTYVL